VRIRQGLVLLGGAGLFLALVGPDPSGFYWTPLGIGLVYLSAAIAGGREGSYWAGALVLVGWGAAVVLVRRGHPDLDTAGLYLAGAGLGAVAGATLARWGFRVDALGAAATIALGGGLLAVQARWDPLTDQRSYALLVGLVGLVSVVRGALSR